MFWDFNLSSLEFL